MLNGKIGKVYKQPFSFYFIEISSPPPSPFVYLILPNVPIPRLLGTLSPSPPPFIGDPRVPVIMFASTLSSFELVTPNLMNFLPSYQKDTNITILLSNLITSIYFAHVKRQYMEVTF